MWIQRIGNSFDNYFSCFSRFIFWIQFWNQFIELIWLLWKLKLNILNSEIQYKWAVTSSHDYKKASPLLFLIHSKISTKSTCCFPSFFVIFFSNRVHCCGSLEFSACAWLESRTRCILGNKYQQTLSTPNRW